MILKAADMSRRQREPIDELTLIYAKLWYNYLVSHQLLLFQLLFIIL